MLIFVPMRQSIAIFFTLIMLSVSCKEIVQYAAFKLNQDSITALFCINKDKPEMKCDGKCYLKKTLESSKEEKNQNKPITPPDEKSLVVYFESALSPSGIAINLKSEASFNYIEPVTLLQSQDIPHPPERLM